jgi:cell division inhibitor SepF
MRKMAVYLGLVEDQLDDEYDEYDEYESARRNSRDPRAPRYDDRYDDRREDRRDDRYDDRYASRSVRPIPESRSVRTFRSDSPSAAPSRPAGPARSAGPASRGTGRGDISRIETLHPRSYNDARRIGEEYRSGVPVIMNLLELDDGDAKRIIDFAAGLVFAMHGSIERITNKVFLLSPSNVDVGDEARAQIAKDGFFNQS